MEAFMKGFGIMMIKMDKAWWNFKMVIFTKVIFWMEKDLAMENMIIKTEINMMVGIFYKNNLKKKINSTIYF